MHRTVFIFGALILGASCGNYSGPSEPRSVYALARVGVHHLPVPLGVDSPLLLLADSLRLVTERPHAEQQILQQTTVIQDGPGGKIGRTDLRFLYQIDKGTLIFDSCPVGDYCAASLVYAPRAYQIVGDSLFEVTPVGVDLPPHVYGLVRNR